VARAGLDEVARARTPGPRGSDDELGEVLCREGLVSREQLQQVSLDRAIEDLERLNGWLDGTFHFHPSEAPGGPSPRGAPIVSKFDLRRLVLEMSRRAEARPAAAPR